jgi:hypothetical protein
VKFGPWMIERSHLDLPPSVKRFGEFTKAAVRDGQLAKNKRGSSRTPMKLRLDALCEHGRGCGFESQGIPAFVNVLPTALSESGCISEKFVGNLSPTD